MESFFSSPKTEYNQPKPTLFWHSTIGYMNPMEFDPQIGLLKRVSSAGQCNQSFLSFDPVIAAIPAPVKRQAQQDAGKPGPDQR
jgi:hypothetical protein